MYHINAPCMKADTYLGSESPEEQRSSRCFSPIFAHVHPFLPVLGDFSIKMWVWVVIKSWRNVYLRRSVIQYYNVILLHISRVELAINTNNKSLQIWHVIHLWLKITPVPFTFDMVAFSKSSSLKYFQIAMLFI